MRIRHLTIIPLLFLAISLFAQTTATSPRLVVSINIDQLRTDFLYEFQNLYSTDNGFKRLLGEGKIYSNGYYAFEHVDRASAVATMMTGTEPYVNGIVAERWLDRTSLRIVDCVSDAACKGLYTTVGASPARLRSVSLPDEMKRATRGKAQVVAIAPDCDVAVLSGGHDADVVLWKNDDTGYWCSSSYYGLFPSWAADLNKKIVGRNSKWEPFFPTELYHNFGDKAPKPFSYSFDGKNDIRSYKTSACMNDEVNEMAIAALRNSDMGLDDIPDFLSLTYYAGNYNREYMEDRPLEIQDTYLRLDSNISDLLEMIDARVGLENVLVYVTSTGYVVEGEGNEEMYRLPTGYVHMDRVQALLNVYLGAIYGSGKYVEAYHDAQIYLDRKFLENRGLNKLDVISHAVEFLLSVEGVEDVFTIYRLGGLLSPELQYVKNGYNSACSGDIWLRLMPGWKMAKDVTAASNLERRTSVFFPMVIWGKGVEHAVIEDMTTASTIAPEIARILRIRRPNDNCLRVFR